MIRYLVALVVALMATVGGLRDAQAQEHGAFALGFYGIGDASATAWAFDNGDSAEAAEDAAVRRCGDLLGNLCATWRTSFTNSCYAVAVSECLLEGCVRPAYGVAGGSSRNEASTAAIAMCESKASSAGAAGTCRVATSDQGEPGVVCVGDAAGRTVETAASPGASSAEWLAVVGNSDERSVVMWAFGVGDDQDSAIDAAREKKIEIDGEKSGAWETIRGGCLAVALYSVHKGSASIYFGPVGKGNSREEAVSDAVAMCERARSTYVGLGNDRVEACRVAASPSGVPGVACVEDFGGGAVQAAASPAEWGALAFGEGLGIPRTWAWAFDYGDTREAARMAAMSRCNELLGSWCSWGEPFGNTCTAIAVSECPSGSCDWPAHGIAGGRTEQEATTAAIAMCEGEARLHAGADLSGTCRVATSDQGEPGVVCVGDAR